MPGHGSLHHNRIWTNTLTEVYDDKKNHLTIYENVHMKSVWKLYFQSYQGDRSISNSNITYIAKVIPAQACDIWVVKAADVMMTSWFYCDKSARVFWLWLSMKSIWTTVGCHTANSPLNTLHDDVIKWKHFQHYWPFVRGIHRSPVNSPHKGQ